MESEDILLNYDNVKLWFAKNENGNIITIDDVNDNNKSNTYSCPMCASNLIPKATKSIKITSHFAHVDASKCNSESMIHWWFKNKFLESGDTFAVFSDNERQYICKKVLTEQSYDLENGKTYRPDVTIVTECGNLIYFEMDYSNKKKIEDYIDTWLELKNIVVEVDIKKLMNKDRVPTFKALFYNGKCFNVKRNDLYYNTIGKYKEERFREKMDQDQKESVRKLDWFWEDVFRYKIGEVDIGHMAILIDSFNKKEKEIVSIILNKPSCISIFKEYISHKSKNIQNNLIGYLDELYPNVDYKISISYPKKTWRSKSLTAEIYFEDVKEKTICSYDISVDSFEKIKNGIENSLNVISKREKNQKNLNYAKSNVHIRNVINRINNKYKERDPKYNFHDRFGYDLYVSMHYDCKYKLDICLKDNDSIIYSTDENLIEDFFETRIDAYMSTVKPFGNNVLIINTLKNVNAFYDNVILKEERKYDKKVSKKRWETIVELIHYSFGIKYRYYAEDLLKITIYKKDKKTNYDCDYKDGIYLYQNDLYYCDKDYHFDTWYENKIDGNRSSLFYDSHHPEINDSIHILKNFKTEIDWLQLESLLIEKINSIISDNLESKCLICKQEYKLHSKEINFFIKNNLNFPRRCKPCRTKNKELKLIKEEIIID